MNRRDRPSLLYVVPGHDFLPTAGPSRNVMSQVRAMRAWADVTAAFRTIVEAPAEGDPPVVEIAPQDRGGRDVVDDAATRGISYPAFARYLVGIRRFLSDRLSSVDVVLEKDWLLTGYVGRVCRGRGVPSIPVKNWVARPRDAWRSPLRAVRHAVAAAVEGRLLGESRRIVAETEFLKAAMVARWGLEAERIDVIGLGVDRDLFRPGDPDEARVALGIDPDARVLVYSGVLDRTHDLEPLLGALVRVGDPGVQLHVIGDGSGRAGYERFVGATSSVVFHGRVPHEQVPGYLAAADLCVAPYDPSSFAGGEVGYSTLKVREYLSAGRAVVTVPSGSLRTLVKDGVTGFLFDNETARWHRFLATLPPRSRLHEMGALAAATDLESWEDVAIAFERLCTRMLVANVDGVGVGAGTSTCRQPGE